MLSFYIPVVGKFFSELVDFQRRLTVRTSDESWRGCIDCAIAR